MTTHNATVAPPSTTAARRFSEQLSALVDKQTREYTLGLAVLAAEEGGYARPREAEVIRALLDEAIAARYKRAADEYEAAVRRGRRELSERAAEAAERVGAVAAAPA